MSNGTSGIVRKVWRFCNPPFDTGVGNEDSEMSKYVNSLSYHLGERGIHL